MIIHGVLLGILGLLAWIDWKSGQLPMAILGISGLAGMFLFLWRQPFLWSSLIGGVAIGGCVLISAIITKERIGIGDGFLLCLTGIYLGLWRNLALLFIAVVLSALFALILLLSKKCTPGQRIPFAPFVLAGDVILLCLTR